MGFTQSHSGQVCERICSEGITSREGDVRDDKTQQDLSQGDKDDEKLFRRAKEVELQSWRDHNASDVANKKVADKDRVIWVLTQAKAWRASVSWDFKIQT